MIDGIENLEDIQNSLGDENEDELEVIPPDGKEGKDGKENEDEDELEEELESEEEGEEGKEKELTTVQFKEVTKKYPNLFKDFPNLRHVFFHEQEYRELFPTVDDAKAALEDVEGLRGLEISLKSGTLEDVQGVLESIKELGTDVITNFADNFLPALQKANQEAYFRAVSPIFVDSVRNLYNTGIRNQNENLQNAAMVMSLHLFGSAKVATGDQEVKLPGKENKGKEKDNELEKERADFRAERYTSFYNDVVQTADDQLAGIIGKGLDPKDTMPAAMKELITEKVSKEIAKVLGSNPTHKNRMNSLWKKAGESNFASNWKSKILSAYLEAAEEVMPRIRSKVRANILGIREHRPGNNDEKGTRREPKSTTGGGQSRGSKEENLDSKKIDWKKTSDIDLFNDRVTFKS